jgi:putative flippase GtrA
VQFSLYLIVGGLSFCIDIGAFVVLRSIELPIILSSVMSFSLATIANYCYQSALLFSAVALVVQLKWRGLLAWC